MNERQEKILKLIVSEYVKNARPVGSSLICKKINCSSATVRNEMAALEDIGFLEKTHISSGRVPSEKGYRYYVDKLMKPKKMTGDDMLKLQTVFHNKSLAINDTISRSLEIISELTDYTTVVLGKTSHDNKLKQVEVVPLGEGKVIAIIITDLGHVEHKTIVIPDGSSLEEVKQIVELINRLVIGTPIDEVSEKLEFEIKPIVSDYIKQYQTLYNSFYNVFADFSKQGSPHFTGRSNFLKQPEFSDVKKIRELFDKFDDKNIINKITTEDNEVKVYIGAENNIDEDITVIKTKYNINGEEGTIAIVGPKRMDYDRVVAMLDFIKENIERS